MIERPCVIKTIYKPQDCEARGFARMLPSQRVCSFGPGSDQATYSDQLTLTAGGFLKVQKPRKLDNFGGLVD